MRIGVDVGFGVTKAATYEGGKLQSVSFPSVLGQAQELAAYALGLGGKRLKARRVGYEGGEWYIGDDALLHSRAQGMRQDRGRIGSPEERLLALVAIAALAGDATEVEAQVVTGLPVLWFEAQDRKALAQSWRGMHKLTLGGRRLTIAVKQVRVIPQPIGGFFSWALAEDGVARVAEADLLRSYALWDVGWNTTDLTAIKDGQPIARWSGGERTGARRVVEIVADRVQHLYGLDLDPHETDTAVRRGYVEPYGERKDIRPLVAAAVRDVADDVKAKATALWNTGEDFARVFIFGGGAILLGKAILEAFPRNGELLPRPELANALGFARFALRNVW
jgi:plasmid segregation protein ParM